LTVESVGLPHIKPKGFITATSEHFIVHTDAAASVYERIIHSLEHSHAVLEQTFFHGVKVQRMNVILLDDSDYFHELFGYNVGGIFTRVDGIKYIIAPSRQSLSSSVLEGDAKSDLERVVTHELAHRFIYEFDPNAPGWLHEGLASLVQTVVVRGNIAAFGAPEIQNLEVLSRGQVLPLAQLLDAPWRGTEGSWATSDYASAWALLHYVLIGLGPRRFVDLLLAAKEKRPNQKWSDVVTGVAQSPSLPALDVQLRDYIGQRLITRVRVVRLFTVPFIPPPKSTYELGPGNDKVVRSVCLALWQRRHN
jgi:hypothetical protein